MGSVGQGPGGLRRRSTVLSDRVIALIRLPGRVSTSNPFAPARDPGRDGSVAGDHGVAATVVRVTDSHSDEVAKQAVAGTSAGRFTHPQDVADLVVLLARVIGRNITDTDIILHGELVKTL
jgi:hypothetical protein